MVEKLKQLKEKSRMTNQQIAEKSNLPESTVARIFSGKTPNPTITTAVSMARAMGGSAADFMNEDEKAALLSSAATEQTSGAAPSDTETPAASANADMTPPANGMGNPYASYPPPTDHSPITKYYEDIILFYKNSIKKKDEWIARLFWCLAGIMMFILFILVFDILHPNFGYVKY